MESPRTKDSIPKKKGKLARAVHSLPILYFRESEAYKKSRSSQSSPKSLSSSENTPKSFKFTVIEKEVNNSVVAFAYDGLNSSIYNVFALKLLDDDGMIFCKGLYAQSFFTFSYELVTKYYEGNAILYKNQLHTLVDGDWGSNDLVFRVYSRNWNPKTDKHNKVYPIYITCRNYSSTVMKFIEDHYYMIAWFM